jgi:superfamily II DNA or RNA helicase
MIKFELVKNKIRIAGELVPAIRDFFSETDATARFRLKGRARHFADIRNYCITPTGLFEAGLFFDILRYIKEVYPDEELHIDSNVSDIIKPTLATADVYDELTLPLRDYQLAACKKAIQFGRGILKMGTGAGKTLTICSLLSSMFKSKGDTFKCLLIVPDLGLVNQTFGDFSEYDAPFKYTKWSGKNKPDFTANVIIANLGILQSQFKDNDWLEKVDALVVDECHKVKKSNKVSKMVQQIRTVHKFGLTGTMPDSKVDEWNIVGKIGSIIYEKDSFQLRTEKHLTPASTTIIESEFLSSPAYKTGADAKLNYRLELDFIYENQFRNNIINQICANFNNNALVLVNHLKHGETLYDLMSALKDKRVYFVKGELEIEERENIKRIMEIEDNVVCIAMSSIFSTGVNIKNIHMIVFAAGGKSSIRTIQTIGRGLRLHDSKDNLKIIDIADQLKYGQKHVARRKEIYEQEKIPYKIVQVTEK